MSMQELEKYWLKNGPKDSAWDNALHYLGRMNFKISNDTIFPPAGFELSKEDKSAVEYLIYDCGYLWGGGADDWSKKFEVDWSKAERGRFAKKPDVRPD